jgi:hypothetical protein
MIFLAKMNFFVVFFILLSLTFSNIYNTLEGLERTWLGESQFTRVGYYGMASYWNFIWVFPWDYWGGVWGVGGACNLRCNGQSSFENQGSIPLQDTSIYNLRMCFKVCMYP